MFNYISVSTVIGNSVYWQWSCLTKPLKPPISRSCFYLSIVFCLKSFKMHIDFVMYNIMISLQRMGDRCNASKPIFWTIHWACVLFCWVALFFWDCKLTSCKVAWFCPVQYCIELWFLQSVPHPNSANLNRFGTCCTSRSQGFVDVKGHANTRSKVLAWFWKNSPSCCFEDK